ncbi:MAG: response regulator [Gammaproteobacteria bacterium]|nr:response regulator [Gammaproteobacteria bacterium]
METILIVDDEPANLQILNSCLANDGLRVIFATSGEMALERLEALEPDLIILDVYMPDIDGFDTYKLIRKKKNLRDIPVIFISVSDDPQNVLKALDMKAVDYITKPFLPEEVSARVKNHLLINRLNKKIISLEEQLAAEKEAHQSLKDSIS